MLVVILLSEYTRAVPVRSYEENLWWDVCVCQIRALHRSFELIHVWFNICNADESELFQPKSQKDQSEKGFRLIHNKISFFYSSISFYS
jgi:hypothetical protein